MKWLLFLGSVVTFAFGAAPNARAQWVRVGLSSEIVDALAIGGALHAPVVAGTNFGTVYRSADSGATWLDTTGDFSSDPNVYALAAMGPLLFAGTENGVYRSRNNGGTWDALGTSMMGAGTFVTALAVSGANVYAGTEGHGLFYSTDSGTTWSAASGLVNANVHTFAVVDSSASSPVMFAGTEIGVYRSLNGGASWSKMSSGLSTLNVFAMTSLGTDGGLFAGTYGGGIFLSPDGGESWSSDAFARSYVLAFASSRGNLFVGISPASPASMNGVFLSPDSGRTWRDVNSGLDLNTSLTDTAINTLAVADGYLFAGTEAGVWRRPLSEMIGSSSVEILPSDKYALATYPNPFTESVTITFTTPKSGVAEVSVVNMLGAEVARIFSGELSAGEHTFTWNATDLPDGMYECIVRMNGQVQRVGLILN